MFSPAVGVAFALGKQSDVFNDAFKADRAKFSGRDFDVAKMKAALPKLLDQLRAHLAHLDTMLGDGRKFLFGDKPGLGDLAPYHCLWFIERNVGADAPPLKDLPRLRDWMKRMARHRSWHAERTGCQGGAGNRTQSDAGNEAGDRCGRSRRPQAGRQGQRSYPTIPAAIRCVGELVASSAQEIVIKRNDPLVGEVMVHFPRAGFIVSAAG